VNNDLQNYQMTSEDLEYDALVSHMDSFYDAFTVIYVHFFSCLVTESSLYGKSYPTLYSTENKTAYRFGMT